MGRESLMLYMVGSLRDLLLEEAERLRELSGPTEELMEKLLQLENMFDDEEVRQDKRTSHIVQDCNQMMDDIDNYVFQVSTNTMFGIRERMLRPKLLLKIQQLTVKITDLVRGHASKPTKEGDVDSDSSLEYEFPPLDEKDFVGRGDDITTLVSYLVDNDDEEEKEHNYRVISICGMGGLGKTTLCKKVLKHEDVKSHFDNFAMVYVGQDCDVNAVLRIFLSKLVPGKKEAIVSMSDSDVIDQLRKFLTDKKCLVVADDIWSVDASGILCRALQTDEYMGSKVLLTTRNRDVAEVGDIVHNLKGLNEDESWELLQRKALAGLRGRDLRVDKQMEKLGKEMVGWCSGNPLAILVLRGVLVTKPALLQWQMVYNRNKGNKHQQLVEGDVARVLALSYNELPYQLKPCYLYICGNEGIRIDRLFMLWSAEGMILSRDKKQGETTIDVANRYLGELVGRNMVEIGVDDLQGPIDIRKLKQCNLHDLMRELCVSIAKKEEFLKVTDVGSHINSKDYNDFRVYIEMVGENRETLDVFPNMAEYTLPHMYTIVFCYNSKWHVNVTPKTSAYTVSSNQTWVNKETI